MLLQTAPKLRLERKKMRGLNGDGGELPLENDAHKGRLRVGAFQVKICKPDCPSVVMHHDGLWRHMWNGSPLGLFARWTTLRQSYPLKKC